MLRFDFSEAKNFDVNMVTKKMKFFLGDRWIVVGDIKTTCHKDHMDIQMPDIEMFLIQREHLDDGTYDWLDWGPRVN